MRFRKNWDSFLIAELARCPAERAVLTTYPPPYTLPAQPEDGKPQPGTEAPAAMLPGHAVVGDDTRPSLLCPASFGADGMLRQVLQTIHRSCLFSALHR